LKSTIDVINQSVRYLAGVGGDPAIPPALEVEGLGADDLVAFQAQLDTTQTLHTTRTDLEGQMVVALKDRDQARTAARNYLKYFRRRVRAAGKHNPLLLDRLPVKGTLPTALAKLTILMRNTLEIALSEEIAPLLDDEGYSQARLEQGQTRLSDLETRQSAYLQAKAAKEQATADLNQAIRVLSRWNGRGTEAARAAFRDNPQQLEALGIQV